MQERILIPLDGSKAAEIVLPYAEEIAAKVGAEIVLASVSEFRAADVDQLYRSYLERIAEQAQSRLRDRGAKEKAKVQSKVLLGKPANEILRCADEDDVSLIAMASRGSSGGGPWLLGNIAAKVLQATIKPVLLIRAPASDAALKQERLVKRILTPLDGSKEGEATVPYTEMLARQLDAELVLFHVLEPVTARAFYYESEAYVAQDEETRRASATSYLAGVATSLQTKGVDASIAVESGAPAERIIAYAGANAIDLIAMSTHGRSGIGRWVFGSVTDKVLHAGDTPVLTARATSG